MGMKSGCRSGKSKPQADDPMTTRRLGELTRPLQAGSLLIHNNERREMLKSKPQRNLDGPTATVALCATRFHQSVPKQLEVLKAERIEDWLEFSSERGIASNYYYYYYD